MGGSIACLLHITVEHRETSATGKATDRVRVLFTFVAGRGGPYGGHGARRRLVGRQLRRVDHHHGRRWLAALRVVAVLDLRRLGTRVYLPGSAPTAPLEVAQLRDGSRADGEVVVLLLAQVYTQEKGGRPRCERLLMRGEIDVSG